MNQPSVVIAGLSSLFREGLEMLLKRSRFKVIATLANLSEVTPELLERRPDILILAVPGEFSEELKELSSWVAEKDWLRVVLLTGRVRTETLREASGLGIRALLSREISGDVLQRSLGLVMLGQQVFPGQPDDVPPRPTAELLPFSRPTPQTHDHGPAQGGTMDEASVRPIAGPCQLSTISGQRVVMLSERERQILRCLVGGSSNKTIARELSIAEATVKVHVKGLLRKIRVNNRTQAAIWAVANKPMLEWDSAPALRVAAS